MIKSVGTNGEKGVTFINGDSNEKFASYKEIYNKALNILYNLQAQGLKPEDELIFQIEDNETYILVLWACILGGIIPVPTPLSNTEEDKNRVMNIWKKLKKPYIITDHDTLTLLKEHFKKEGLTNINHKSILLEQIEEKTGVGVVSDVSGENTAIIQFSSGSTGTPKGIIITHRNLLKTLHAHITCFNLKSTDSFLSWLPLTFTFGLIIFLIPVFANINQFLMPKSLFIRQPFLWLKKADQHQTTITCSANFGYKHFLDYFKPEMAEDWNLSHLRIMLNGGEPISSELCIEFLDRMSPYGLEKTVITPAYGMTETLAMTYALGALRTACIDRNSILTGQIVKETTNTENGICFVELGYPLENCDLRICDSQDKILDENTMGHIQAKGNSVTSGYYGDIDQTREIFTADGWIKTGDLGFIRDGSLVLTGRAKDIIFVNGKNFYPHDIENLAIGEAKLKPGNVIACSALNRKSQKEDILLFVAYKDDLESFAPLATLLKDQLSRKIGSPIKYVIPIKQIPKNNSGKVQRFKLIEQYQEGEFNQTIQKLKKLTVTDYIAPEDELEEELVLIWQDILEIEKIGTKDNFFELGGHSLKATKLVSQIHQEFNVDFPLRKVFQAPTIKEMAEYIKGARESIYSTIQPIDDQDYYPMSSAQKRQYILDQLDNAGIAYNNPYLMLVEGHLDCLRFEEVFQELISRHETLRTSFAMVNGEPVQKIHEKVDFNINYLESTEEEAKKIIKGFIKPFDLNQAPLLRVNLIKIKETKHLLFFDMHHIISDATSMNIFLQELIKLYEGNSLPDLRIQYKDYSVWQEKQHTGDFILKQEEYWLETFNDEIPVLNMPLDFSRPVMQSFEGDSLNFKIDRELVEKLNNVAQDSGATLYMILLAALNTLLSKYTGQEDIVVGSPIAGRPQADLENLIGMFVNTLAMRNYPVGEKTFRQFLENVKENSLKAYESQYFQFEELVEKLNIKRDLSRNPIFDVMFVLLNMDRSDMTTKELNFTVYENPSIISKFDITLYAMETPEGMTFDLEYCTQLFKKETIKRLTKQFIKILEEVVANPDLKLKDIDMITEEEKSTILFDFNNNQAEYPQEETIQEIFEKKVELTPDNIALVYRNNQLTYQELNKKANQLAHVLRNKGVKPDDIVGLLVERSPEMIIAIMAVLKAGGAYLPIDPSYPEKRIHYMLQDSSARILLTQHEYESEASFNGIILDLKNPDTYKGDPLNPEKVNTSHNLAYVIYTSGSTGNPKGVLVNHNSLTNMLLAMQRHYPLLEDDAYLMKTAYTFDVSLTEIFGWFHNNGRLVLLREGEEKDPKRILEAIEEYGVTHINFVPSMLNIFTDTLEKENQSLNKLKYVFSAGETITENITHKFYEGLEGNLTLENLYGPTEGTVYTTRYSIKREKENKNIPIGKPLDNIKAYILDRNSKIQPIGIPGELCIAGEGLARGYLNKPELTDEFFVDNPFMPGERLYRTGDLARWLRDGNIEFLGRIDHQVKIRGYRIELGEIENQLLKHPSLKETLVMAREDMDGDSYLCAYYVGDEELTTQKLRTHLSQFLPEYMIPAYFIKMESMPLTPNGKINQKALPEPDGSIRTGVKYIGPRDIVEEKLILLWQDILGINRVGIRDNFFELGGHSLKATTLVSRIHKEFNVDFPLKKVFQTPTVAEMAVFIRRAGKSIYSDIQIVEEREYYPMSSAQIRLYILDQFDKDSIAYNIPGVMLVEGPIDLLRFEEVFQELIMRHDTLRTSFAMVNGEPVQKIHEEVDFNINYLESTEEEAEEIIKGFIKPFDLNQAPILRVNLIKIKKDKHLLLFDMHHIISDGISMSIFLQELIKLYEGKSLPDLRIQYKDYSVWQKKQHTEDFIQKQEEYWLEIFNDEIPVLDIPLDHPRPSMQSFEGDRLNFEINKELAEKLNSVAQDAGATLYMILLAAFNTLLSKYTGQEDIVVGSPIAGRPHFDLENIIGVFYNVLAMRNYPEGDKTFKQFLKDVKENALNAYENQDVQFEELVEKLKVRRDLSRNPLFDVAFVLQNIDMNETEVKGLKFTTYETPFMVTRNDILLGLTEKEEGELAFVLEYCTKLFQKETMQRFAKHYQNILESIAENPDLQLKDIEMLSDEEENALLYDESSIPAEYPHKTIKEIFEEQVEHTPDNIAITYEDNQLTYKELNEKSNQLARVLRDKGVKPDDIVGLLVERSLEMIIGMLGVLKAGGAYMPIDPQYPTDRIKYMMENSAADLLLITNDSSNLLDWSNYDFSVLNFESESIYQGNSDNLDNVNEPGDLAYIIYTSGTTGNPKGVMVEHRNVVRLFCEKIPFHFNENDVWTMFHSYCFDFSVWEMYGALLTGAKLIIVPQLTATDTKKFLKLLKEEKVTILNQTPTAFYNLIKEELKNDERDLELKYVVFGGEGLKPTMLKEWMEKYPLTKLINMYGITETTVHVTFKEIGEQEIRLNTSNIGKPLPTDNIYIMDQNMKLVPIGVAGELHIGGTGVARGYLNNKELSNEKFIPNPYRKGEKLYKSGDIAKLLPNKEMEHLGRTDYQVKIRGYRIEPGEIENRLLEHPSIKETIVIAKEDLHGNKYLCDYYVSNEELTTTKLREHLSTVLPNYMVPSHFIKLEKMPINPNGKIDRKTLPEPDGSISTGVEYVAPRDDFEKLLTKIWEDILGVKKVGIEDNFFDLGGNSLTIINLLSRVLDETGTEIPIRTIFEHPTIKGIAENLKKVDVYHENVLLFNDEKEKNIFAFPGMGTFALMYMEMASKFKNHSFYAFNFIESNNRIEEYADIICDIQESGPYILLGYSAGGNLAFEVAKELNSRGLEVSELILLDSPYKKVKINLTDEAIGKYIKFYTAELKNYKQYEDLINDSYIKNNANKKIKLYAQFYINFINSGVTSANIHLINAESSNRNDWLKIGKGGWEKSTSKSFTMHNGHGTHHNMLIDDFLEQNTEIIRKIIND